MGNKYRKKKKFISTVTRNLKHIPYGSQICTNYGGEIYIKSKDPEKRGLYIGLIINKRKLKREIKKYIKSEIENFYNK